MRMLNTMAPTWVDDFDRVVDSFLNPTFTETDNFLPACDVDETKGHYLVSFDIPGVRKKDINIELDGNKLMISGERHRQAKNGDGETMVRHERSYGTFQRIFTLPNTVDAESIEAHYEDGVLEVVLPKTEKAQGRKINIQSGKSGLFDKFLGSRKGEKESTETSAS